jgi:uncharacterized protein
MTLRKRLTAALPTAMKARDAAAVSALRSALAAIDNAAAVEPAEESGHGLPAIGLGVTEVPRRDQDHAEIERIVRAEITDRTAAAAEYDGLGRTDRADRLRAEAQALVTLLRDQ